MKKIVHIGNGKTKILNTETAEIVAIKYTQGMRGYKWTYNLKFYKTIDGFYFYTYNGVIYSDWSREAATYGTVRQFLEETIGESQFIFFKHYPSGGFETTSFLVFFDDSDEARRYVDDIKEKYDNKFQN